MENEKKIKVVLLEPGNLARATEIDASLAGMQKTVGGLIEPRGEHPTHPPAHRAERVSVFLHRIHTVRCGCQRFRVESLRRCPAPFASCPAAYDNAGCAVPDS